MSDTMKLFINFFTPLCYFYFNWKYFSFVTASLQILRIKKGITIAAFFVNYALFWICSILEFNLIVNWLFFFLFLLCETLVYCKGHWAEALYCTLNGIIFGLAVNIFCRCIISAAIEQPLAAFDNNISSVGNLKGIPVLLGFLLGGISLSIFTFPMPIRRVRTLLGHPRHLNFLLKIMSIMFVYLFLNLLIYQSHDNGILLKMWGIKSCAFSVIGSYLGLRYSLQLCDLSDYREQNRVIRSELVEKSREEEALRDEAYRDSLTGCYSRQYTQKIMDSMLEKGVPFAICFADLDGLKQVNDQYGHNAGDYYIITVAQRLEAACRKERDILIRYGGDEFLLLMPDTSVETVAKRMKRVNEQLKQLSGSKQRPFAMELSVGIAHSGGGKDGLSLIREADERMYENKKRKM